jgi:hypothetical protein
MAYNGVLNPGDSTYTFSAIELADGPLRLQTELALSGVTKGAWQVDVSRLN